MSYEYRIVVRGGRELERVAALYVSQAALRVAGTVRRTLRCGRLVGPRLAGNMRPKRAACEPEYRGNRILTYRYSFSRPCFCLTSEIVAFTVLSSAPEGKGAMAADRPEVVMHG